MVDIRRQREFKMTRGWGQMRSSSAAPGRGPVIKGVLEESPHVGDVAIEVFDLPLRHVDRRQGAAA